jgi:hypothetical protein
MTQLAIGMVTVEPKASNGLIFKKLGYVYSYEESKRVITTYSGETLRNEQTVISKQIKQLQNLTQSNDQSIAPVLSELFSLSETISEINSIIFGENGSVPIQPAETIVLRKKRSLFPWGGKIVKWILGNADEYEVRDILDEIETNRQNNIFTEKIVRNHTISIEKLLNIMERRSQNVDKEINSIIDQLQTVFSRFNNASQVIDRQNEINTLTQALTLGIIRYRSTQDKILQHVLASDMINIDPELISLSFLENTLFEIEKTLQHQQMLPWSLIKNNRKIEWYKTISMCTFVIDKNIVFEFIIPIISRSKRELYEIIPAPMIRDEYLIYIQPETPYIITNSMKTEIGYLNEADIEKCIKINGNEYICSSNLPIFNKKTNENYCELTIFLKTEGESNNCVFKTMPKRDSFIKIKDTEQYYYVAANKIVASTLCKDKPGEVVLEGTGLLTINESCSVFSANFRITSQSITNVVKQNDYVISSFMTNTITNGKSHKYIMHTDELSDITKEFDSIRDKLKNEEIIAEMKMQKELLFQAKVTHHVHTGVNISITLIFCIFSVFLVFCIFKIKKPKASDVNFVNYHGNDKKELVDSQKIIIA